MKKKNYIIISIAVIIVSLIGLRVYNKIKDSQITVVETNLITVEGEAVRKGTVNDYAVLTGTITAEQTVSIIPTVPAIVRKINVEVGDEVKQGELLFQLETEDIQNQVTQANAGLEQAQLGVLNAQEAAKQAQTGYDMAKANYDLNFEKYEFSRENLAKYDELYKEGIISEAEYKQTKLQASESTLEILNKQLQQAEQSKNQANLGIENAKAMVKQAQAGYNTASGTLEDTSYTAPINGYVSSINVVESMFASNAQPAMVINYIDKVTVNVDITENMVNKLVKGQEVEVVINSLGDKVFKGTLKTISPAADARTLLYSITVEVDNKNHEIKPGMFANVKLRTEEKKDALYVKGEAVFFQEGKNFIFVEKENNAIERRELEVGIDNGEYIEILKGLTGGEIYIYKGVGFLDEDSLITMVRGDQ
ncbi:MAG: hypothetical protein CVU84_15355 [Firmicutes bacterium HGW-Firmicutes-1]|jgi:RND family efflux transporter MFP subunit|nr:MAG: hypothetical protein CVU84_15355 [Firmicutes bacterium HGW-Firmicutes-1]